MKPILSFENFSFKYRAQTEPTLHNINLTIYEGEKILIVGASGSGKSTLAHCINGLVPFAYSGEISGTYQIKGQDPAALGIFGLSQIVGTVLQDTDGQFIGLTVAEDIAFALENDKVKQDNMKERVAAVADMVEVKELLSHAPSALSGGQKQRVSMSGVMVNEVDILLFDEPLANLDPATGKKAIALIDDIWKKQHSTILIIEHRLEDALYRNMDRIIVMAEGRIVADASPDELLVQNVLKEQGLREPFYLTALKHAGCQISADTHPAHIDTMNLTPYKEKLLHWYASITPVIKEPKTQPLLEVHNLYFSYQEKKPILEDVDFTIHKGEMVALVGKNGAGKSTLSSLICGFHKPDSGQILFDGEDISGWSIKERGEKIGLVMQSPNQMISKPMIYDEVALGLRVRGMAEEEIKETVHKVLKICGLYPFRNWPVSALSFGQKKRVTIASILALNPEVLILDEPTAGQDYRHYTEIMEFLKDLNETYGITILMITHDMYLMLEYTDRTLVLADGRLLADDKPANILADKALADKAYLKTTSLSELAVRCGINEPAKFVDWFIQEDRNV